MSIPPGGSGSGGSGTLPDAATATVTTTETTGAFSIPAGALWIEIRNAGLVQSGDVEANATVAGQSWSPGREQRFEAVLDAAANEYKRLPAIAGNGNGSRVMISYAS